MNNKDFEYIALTKETNSWRIGTFDENGVVEEANVPNIDGMVKFIQAQYGMKPVNNVAVMPSFFNALRQQPKIILN